MVDQIEYQVHFFCFHSPNSGDDDFTKVRLMVDQIEYQVHFWCRWTKILINNHYVTTISML